MSPAFLWVSQWGDEIDKEGSRRGEGRGDSESRGRLTDMTDCDKKTVPFVSSTCI